MRAFLASVTYWDVFFFHSIFHRKCRRLTAKIIRWISRSGDGCFYPPVVLLVYACGPEKAWPFLCAGLTAYGIELPLYKLTKCFVKRHRPYEALTGVKGCVVPIDRFSFPSGHTAAAFIMAVLLSHYFPVLSIPLYLWACGVSVSRIFLGVHYPSDIMAGVALGVASAHCGLVLGG